VPVDTSLNEQTHTVICTSRLSYQKGIDVLLQAWKLVLEQLPQARLILVGSGDLQPQLRRMARELRIVESVEFAGLQSDVTAQFHRGGMAVLPSRCEGMSNALLEAMSCGLPCIATRVSGSEDLITHGINGLLVEPEDYGGLAQALLTLLRDPLLAQRYAQAARATIEKHFSLNEVADKYVELYRQMVGSGTGIAEPARPPEIYHLPLS
jgi:glycosyltransferase involved in cell wall biosynthesis